MRCVPPLRVLARSGYGPRGSGGVARLHSLPAPRLEEGPVCTGCHALPDEAVHADVLGRCAGCHGFHGGGGEPLWTARNWAPCHPGIDAHPDYHGEAPMTECNRCHAAHDPRNLLAAAASGRCTACDGLHAASGPALLRSGGDELCPACHDTSRHTHRLSVAGVGPRVHVPAERVSEGGGWCAGAVTTPMRRGGKGS